MYCIFCYQPILFNRNAPPAYVLCETCSSGEIEVGFSFTDKNKIEAELLYAHIHMYYGTNEYYHVRLHLLEHKTAIRKDRKREPILFLPGFPLNPTNIKNKLKLYLTFS